MVKKHWLVTIYLNNMKEILKFLTIIMPMIVVYIMYWFRTKKILKSLTLENEILKHDAPSRIVDSYRIKVSEDNLRATIECGAYPKGMKIIFSTKSDNETLDTYDLTLKELLNILQEHNNKNNFYGYCSKETVEGKRCKYICDKPECGW